MFNETDDQPVTLFAHPCPEGQVQDYDPETRTFLPGCVDDTVAYRARPFPTGGVPAQLDMMPWILGGAVLLGVALLFGGRR